jgi:hypothetical protein
MVLECAFDELVKNIWGEHLVNIRTGKVIGERLYIDH